MWRNGSVLVVALASAVWASPVAAQDWSVREEACDRSGGREDGRRRWCELRQTTLPAGAALDLDGGPNGGIEVVGWERDEVEIVAHVRTHGRDGEEARRIAGEIRIEVDGGRVRAEGPPTRRRADWGISYEIRVPRRTDLDLSTTNGGITLEDVSGELELETTNGGLRLTDVSGDVRGHTTNGGVRVRLSGERWEGEGLDVTTTNGSVVLEIPEGYSARLETGTTNGSVDLDFPVTVQGRIGRDLRTTLGDGGPTIRVKTTNGTVRLVRR